jgi:uncharacterized protein (DUF342 family)
MWNELTRLTEDKANVIAQLPPGGEVGPTFSANGLERVLDELGAGRFYLDPEAVNTFVRTARESKSTAFEGVVVAQQKNAEVTVNIEDHDLLASMTVTGAYGGRGLTGAEIMHALATSGVVKGINKLALKKVLAVSHELKGGETFVQPVAVGVQAKNGRDARFIPLVEDIDSRVLKPQKSDDKTGKVDMRDLGATITVDKGKSVMKRVPATRGTPGYTVLGSIIQPQAGKDTPLKEGKGTVYNSADPNILIAAQSGMPIIKNNSVDVDPALVLKNIDVSTGHVKFKGSIVISGNIEPGMVVRATGSITVGGFIEAADVQAQEDIIVGQGIIGHAVDEGEEKNCTIKTNGSIKSKYAQYAFLQSMGDIALELHCLNSNVMCSGDLTVMDGGERKGTLSGGVARVGGKVTCVSLGVEGDTATVVQPFVRFNKYKQGLQELTERYRTIQAKTMDVVRKEIEFKKRPKDQRTDEELQEIEALKQQTNDDMVRAKEKREWAEAELERMLKDNVLLVKGRVFTRVTVQYGDEVVITKREHNAAQFSFDQYSIHCRSMVEGKEEEESEL